MKKIFLSLSIMLSISLHARNDVIPQNGLKQNDEYVKVTKLTNGNVKFQRCLPGQEKTTCKTLGNKSSYTVEELERQELIESIQFAGSVAGIAAAGYLGFWAGVGLTGIAGDMLVNIIVGSTAAPVLTFAALNPIEQYRQCETLVDEVINDNEVRVKDVQAFIKRIDLVLKKIK